jgi:hypothetical protein
MGQFARQDLDLLDCDNHGSLPATSSLELGAIILGPSCTVQDIAQVGNWEPCHNSA